MKRVVADTGPLQYLVLIEAIGILPEIFQKILLPDRVQAELSHPRTPLKVRQFLACQPPWLDMRETLPVADLPFPQLGQGERSTIAVARNEGADLVLMDDRKAVAIARAEGLAVIGTLGVLDLASRRGLIDLAPALARLKATNFRCRQAVIDNLLAAHKTGKGKA